MQNIHRYIQVQEQKGVMQAISLENIKAIRSLGRQKREKGGPECNADRTMSYKRKHLRPK